MRDYDLQLLDRTRTLIDASKDGRVVLTREDYHDLVCFAYGVTHVMPVQTRTVTMSMTQAVMLLGLAKRQLADAVKKRLRS